MESKKGQMGIIGAVIGLVTLVVGLVIVDQVVKTQTFNSSLAETIKDYLVPIGMLGALGVAATVAYSR